MRWKIGFNVKDLQEINPCLFKYINHGIPLKRLGKETNNFGLDSHKSYTDSKSVPPYQMSLDLQLDQADL
jgi:hypothetical protein